MNKHLDWIDQAVARPDARFEAAAQQRQAQLTKPAGSLGELEALAIRLAALQARERPQARAVHIAVFAADHGIAQENVSAFPQSVTAQMIDNFASGGAAIAVLAQQLGASFEVIDLGTVVPSAATTGVRRESIGAGTANFAREPAMRPDQLAQALAAGRQAVERAVATGCDIFIGGEMGIANTTSATALACALLGRKAAELAGRGTGLDEQGLAHKIGVIQRALDLHGPHCDSAREILRRLGGFEIAALAGACIACAQQRVPMLVDGFIVSVAALCAQRLVPDVAPWLIFAHRSAEPGHSAVLTDLNARALLDLGLRLGEASGAAVALPLLRLACELHNGMATFAEAGVGRKQDLPD